MSRGLSQRNSVLTSTSRRSCPRRRTRRSNNPVRRKIRRDGRRRRQRRTGAHESRRRYRHRLGDRCRHRVGDIILVDNNPLDVVRLIRLSKASYRKMQENLVWATGYNVFALPLAAGILAPSASSCRRRSAPCSCRCRRSSSRSTLADWGTSTSQYLRNPQSQPCQSLRQCCSGLDSCPEGYYSVGFSFVSGASQAGSGPTAPATGRSGSGGQHGPSHS